MYMKTKIYAQFEFLTKIGVFLRTNNCRVITCDDFLSKSELYVILRLFLQNPVGVDPCAIYKNSR